MPVIFEFFFTLLQISFHVKKTLIIATLILTASCADDSYDYNKPCSQDKSDGQTEMTSDTDTTEIKSDYDLSTVEAKDLEEFKENLAIIEKKHGEQWDFCTCVVKNDSINKAFMGDVSDEEFDRLSDRFDVIDQHCKAFLTQSSSVTPEERAIHEKKVRKCLKEAGVR